MMIRLAPSIYALDPIRLKAFEEKTSGTLATDDRPGLLNALGRIREGDLLTVHEVDRLGRNLLEGLIVLNDLFRQGIGVKVLEGIAAGEHTGRSLILDIALALAEDRRKRGESSGESIRAIAAGVKVSVGVVHKTRAEARLAAAVGNPR